MAGVIFIQILKENCCKLLSNSRDSVFNSGQQVRFAKLGSSAKKQRGPGRSLHIGWKKQDGNFVRKGTILATQRNLRYFPGLNVGLKKNYLDNSLIALQDGTVAVTCEKVNPRWDNPFMVRAYSEPTTLIYKKYYNVIAKPQGNTFTLVETI